MLSGKKLPSLVIVAMGNPQWKCELLPQTKQRFWWVNVSWHAGTWKTYMLRRWGINVSPTIITQITEQYRDGFSQSSQYNYYTPRTMENLFRVGMEIDQDDPFWEVSDVSSSLVDAIYKSIEGKDEFNNIIAPMMDWLKANPNGDQDNFALVYELSQCHTMDDLKTLIKKLEDNETYPQFLQFLKESGEADDE